MPLHYLGGGSSGSDRSVFALYHRWICYWQRRLLHVYLFLAIFSAYSGDRPFSPLVDGIKMSCIQFFVCSAVSSIFAFTLENPSLQGIFMAWGPLLYAGILSCGIAYTLQIVGQKNLNPTVASLILSMESCISVLAGWVLLGQKLTIRELSGCVLMFVAIILAQLPEKKPKKSSTI